MGIKKFLKAKGAILEYGDFYKTYRDGLIRILENYYVKSYRIAIWGAGLKGTAFLNCIDLKGKYISTVIDMKKELHGTSITKHHRVSSIEEAISAAPDVILIMNAEHYADNYALLKERGYNGIILDLDVIIENSIDPEDIIEGRSYDAQYNKDYDLNKIHLQVLDILSEIDRICRKHNITYFLSAGTALGAIRHKGFIPWDDDADVGMLREDFDRFRLVVENEMGSEFYYERMEKGSDYYRPFDKIGKKKTSFVLYHLKDLRMRHGIHVDIFPFDNVSKDEIKRGAHVKELQLYRERIFKKLVPHVVKTKNIWKKLIINHEYYLMKFVNYNRLHRKMESALKKYEEADEGYVADLLTHYKKIMYFKKEYIIPIKHVPFENLQLPVPNNPDAYLRMMYGDYMTPPPEGKRNQRHRIYELSYNDGYYKDKLLFKEK